MDSVKRELKSRMDKLDARDVKLDARMDKLDERMYKLLSNQERLLDILSANTAAVRDLAACKATDAQSGSRGDAHGLAADVGETTAGQIILDSDTLSWNAQSCWQVQYRRGDLLTE
jgi:hypothetical protein